MGEEEGISNKKKAILLGAMILSGAANTVGNISNLIVWKIQYSFKYKN